jgi:uncharacterized protein
MPWGDGTGPSGRGPGTGRGLGRGMGRGRMQGDRAGAGPGGMCVCPACGEKAAHEVGVPCNAQPCPRCGTRMTRD